ncbi:hypothetical protein BDR05DRAFT_180085 [Suillus weaverae]|nr:hypothetical protein BDR05DRAFT_180085 [Suillus weaverae]
MTKKEQYFAIEIRLGPTHNATPLWMKPQFMRFSDLPTELALLIFKYAAQTTFAQHTPYTTRNPYSSALSLSRVSKIVRRTVLSEILHTVLLPEARQRHSFRTGSAYAENIR